MLEHRRNGWYALGGAMMAAGIAWLATWGVAVSSSSPPRSLHYWISWSYVAVGLIAFGFLIIVGVMYDFPVRLPRASRADIDQGSRVNPTSRPPPSAAHEALTLELVDARWKLWQRASWLTDIQVRITNTTPNRVIELTHFELESDPGPSWGERPRLTQQQVDTLFDQMLTRGEAYGPAHLRQMVLQPGDSRLGWFASHAYLPYPIRKGKPYCEFTVTDDEGETYTLPIPGQGTHAFAPPHDLLRLRNRAIEGVRMRERLPADGSQPNPHELGRFGAWTVKVTDALESHPDYLAQFQRTLTPETTPSSTEIEHSIETLEAIVRALECRIASAAKPGGNQRTT